jgi:hypothetical protein
LLFPSRVNRRQGSHLIPFGKLPNQERLWETQGTWALAKSLLTLQPANSRRTEHPGTGKTVGGGEGPPGGYNRENIPFLYSSLWQTPEMLVEIETAWSASGYLLVCFSAGRLCPRRLRLDWKIISKCSVFSSFPTSPLGYFIHDTVDIVVSKQTRASWEYLVHHVMVRENPVK